jgi:hypothetical protein
VPASSRNFDAAGFRPESCGFAVQGIQQDNTARNRKWRDGFAEREQMKSMIIALACAMIAPLAFAQTTGSTTQTKATQVAKNQIIGSLTQTGIVDDFIPGQTIRVQLSPDAQPVSYALGKRVQYIDQAGRKISSDSINDGARVTLDFGGPREHSTVDRVILLNS